MPHPDPATATLLAEALPNQHSWSDRPRKEDLAPLPGCPAIYLLNDAGGAPVLLATTQHLRHLLLARLTDPEQPRRGKADLAEIVRGVRWRPLATAFEGRWWYYRLARVLHPQEYRQLIAFGPAWFLSVDWGSSVPEIDVTDRVWCARGEFIGPWSTRASAQQALEGLWDLFDLCRYPEQVRRAPRGQRCAYAEMGRCDAPCDGSISLTPYAERCRAAWRFAIGAVDEWIAAAEARMKQVATERKYELAAQIKHQLDFARHWRSEWLPNVRPTSELNYVVALRASRRRAWKLLLFRGGHIADGPLVSHRRIEADAAAWLRDETIRAAGELACEMRMEQTWLLAHLLYSRGAESAVIMPIPLPIRPDEVAARLRAVADARRALAASKGTPTQAEHDDRAAERAGG